MPVPDQTAVAARSLLREDALRAIRAAIVDGTFAPGERLVDAELCRWLGVSRTPVREALARLESAGLVVTRPGRWTIVSPLDVRRTRDAQRVVAGMHELAVREAVPQLTAEHLDAMRAANADFLDALERHDVDAALAADDAFHAVAVDVAGNEALAGVLEQYTPLLRRVERVRFGSRDGRDSHAQHEHIVELAAAGDAEAAGREARLNWLTLHPEATEVPGAAGTAAASGAPQA